MPTDYTAQYCNRSIKNNVAYTTLPQVHYILREP